MRNSLVTKQNHAICSKLKNEIESSKLASNQALLYICPKRLAEAGKVASLIKAIASGAGGVDWMTSQSTSWVFVKVGSKTGFAKVLRATNVRQSFG